jgi:hypothetical protein
MEPNPYLVGSSLLFVIPTTMGAYYRQWDLYFTFLFITLISSLYHATKNKYLLCIDYVACYNIVYVLYYNTRNIGYTYYYMIGTSSCAVLFWGGYLTNHFIFSTHKFERNVTHIGMHLIVVVSGIFASYLINKEQIVLNEN